MKQENRNNASRQNRRNADAFNFLLPVISIFALSATFLLSYADFDYRAKIYVFSAIIAFYVAFCVFNYLHHTFGKGAFTDIEDGKDFDANVQNRLLALEEANEYFGAALKPADMLRLVSDRVKELVSFETCAFFISDENKENLKVEYAFGTNAQSLKNLEIKIEKGLAGKTFESRRPQIDEKLLFDKSAFPTNFIKDFQTTITVPLFQNGETFGVLQLFSFEKGNYDKKTIELLEAIGERVSPLFSGSIAFERSLSNALTDALTALPNERAFFLVLENQIAESTRFQPERPLSILCVDINDFSEFNQKFGHATGDRFLSFAGENIKNQLRQMDFLARSAGDEFLVALPTASEKIANEIVERIERYFLTKPFELNENEKIHVKLNFGSATFGRDGETAPQLLKAAALRKQQSKSNESSKILWFPKEYAN